MGLRHFLSCLVIAVTILFTQACGSSAGASSSTSTAAGSQQSSKNPVPVITGVHGAKGEGPTLHVVGSGFVSSSAVYLNGKLWTSKFISATDMTVQVLESDVPNNGVIEFRVVNPAPGGGPSNVFTTTFTTAPGTITSLAPDHAPAGSSALTLTVQGRDFAPTSVVRFNGKTLATMFANFSLLTATVPADSLAQAGTFPVTVFTDGVAGGAVSNAVNFTVDPKTGPPSGQSMPLRVNSLLFNPTNNTLYATVPGASGAEYGNKLVEIAPQSTPTIVRSTLLGSEPGPMALSNDGITLYVGLQGAGAIRRFDTHTHTAGLQFALGSDPSFGVYTAKDIAIQPGASDTIAVTLAIQSSSPDYAGLAVFANGVRKSYLPRMSAPIAIEFGSQSNVLYGLGEALWGFRRFRVNADDSLTLIDTTNDFSAYLGNHILWNAGRIYGDSGAKIDPDMRSLIGTYPATSSSHSIQFFVPDPSMKRVFFIRTGFSTSPDYEIAEFDMDTFVLLNTKTVPVQGEFVAAAYLQNGNFAIGTTNGRVYFVSAY